MRKLCHITAHFPGYMHPPLQCSLTDSLVQIPDIATCLLIVMFLFYFDFFLVVVVVVVVVVM